MPARRSDINLQPIIGYLMWHQARGLTQAQALRQAKDNPHYSSYSSSQLSRASYQADRNVKAQEKIRGPYTTQELGKLFHPQSAKDSVIGLRILVTVTLPSGAREERSITVNAVSGANVSLAVADALEWAKSTNFGHGRDKNYQATITLTGTDRPRVIQAIEGGLANPNVICNDPGGCR